MKKPIQLAIEETKENIVNFINQECEKNKIDYYFLESILKEIYQETLKLKDEELKQMKEEVNNELHKD